MAKRRMRLLVLLLAYERGVSFVSSALGGGYGRVVDRRRAVEGEFEEFEVFSRKSKLSEERYPYEVVETTPPRPVLGVFSLSPTIGCGDVLRFDGVRAYKIKRIASQYKYIDGRFQLRSKRAEATELRRAAIESHLERVLIRSPKGPSSKKDETKI